MNTCRPLPLTKAPKSILGWTILGCLAVLPFQGSAYADGFTSGCAGGSVFARATPNANPVSSNPAAGSCSAEVDINGTDTIFTQTPGDVATFTQSASATVNGSVSPGLIRLSAIATATSTPGGYVFLDESGEPFAVNNNENAAASAIISASWSDLFTIIGTPGTPVTLAFTVNFRASVSANPLFVGEAQAGDTLNVSPFGGATISYSPVFGTSCIGAGEGVPAICGPGTATFDITVFTGQTLTVQDGVTVNAQACAGGFPPGFAAPSCGGYVASSFGIADASDTATVVVTDLTPGTSFSTASGFNYAQPPSTVLEPGTLVLFGSGLTSIVGFMRRKILV